MTVTEPSTTGESVAAQQPGAPAAKTDAAAGAVPTSPAQAAPPAAPAGAGYVGALCALALIGVGVVGIHDGIVGLGWIGGPHWAHSAATWVNGQSFHVWMIPAGVIAVLVGLALVAVAVKPRRKRAVALQARSGVYLDLSDTAQVAAAAARTVPGVLAATAKARRRKLTIRSQHTGADPAALREAINEAVTDTLGPLARTPRIRVRTRIGGR